MTTIEPQPSQTRAARRPLQPYTYAESRLLDETGAMEYGELPPAIAALKAENYAEGIVARLLFAENPTDPSSNEGISIVHAWVAPYFPLPAHAHDSDCSYYVASGSIELGKRVLRAGDGLFVPAGSTYRYVGGPEGAEVIEFRTALHFDYEYRETSESRWEEISDTAIRNRDLWREAWANRALKHPDDADYDASGA